MFPCVFVLLLLVFFLLLNTKKYPYRHLNLLDFYFVLLQLLYFYFRFLVFLFQCVVLCQCVGVRMFCEKICARCFGWVCVSSEIVFWKSLMQVRFFGAFVFFQKDKNFDWLILFFFVTLLEGGCVDYFFFGFKDVFVSVLFSCEYCLLRTKIATFLTGFSLLIDSWWFDLWQNYNPY